MLAAAAAVHLHKVDIQQTVLVVLAEVARVLLALSILLQFPELLIQVAAVVALLVAQLLLLAVEAALALSSSN
jgi:hypothetical protein